MKEFHTYASLKIITEAKSSSAWTKIRTRNITAVVMTSMTSPRTLVNICHDKTELTLAPVGCFTIWWIGKVFCEPQFHCFAPGCQMDVINTISTFLFDWPTQHYPPSQVQNQMLVFLWRGTPTKYRPTSIQPPPWGRGKWPLKMNVAVMVVRGVMWHTDFEGEERIFLAV